MMRKAIPAFVVSCALSGALATGCGSHGAHAPDAGAAQPLQNGLTQAQAKQVLVKIGDETITVGELADRLADQSPYLRARYQSPERRREFLDNLIRFELLATEAQHRGYDTLPEVQRTAKQVMIQQMMKDLFEDKIKLSDITDAEIQQYYQQHQDEFHKPAQMRASRILVRNRAKAQHLLSQILAHANDVSLFRQLAQKNNEDAATRDRFGDLHFFSKPGEQQPDQPDQDTVPAPIAEAAFKIEQIGGVYPQLVHTDDGWNIVKLTGRRAALNRTLEEARRPIQNRLWRQKREQSVDAFIAKLRHDAHIQENPDVLADVHIELPGGARGAAAGSDGQAPQPPEPAATAHPTTARPHGAPGGAGAH